MHLEAQPRPGLNGGMLVTWAPGSEAAKNAGKRGVSMRAVRKKCRELLLEADEGNTRELLALCKNDDARVRVVAIQEAKNRLWGRVGDTGLAHDPDSTESTYDHMTPAEREEMRLIMRRMKELTRPPAERGGVVIEGEGDPAPPPTLEQEQDNG